MVACTFLFDIVVVHIEAPDEKIPDAKKLSIEVKLGNVPIKITSSRINVSEFQPARTLEFNETPEDLSKALQDCGLPITVEYNGKVLGIGQMTIPEDILEKISDQMDELTYTSTCDFEKEGKVKGKVEILMRLLLKCTNVEADNEKGKAKREIAPQDILFIVGQSQKVSNRGDPGLDAWDSEPGDEQLKLDLSRYQDSNTKALFQNYDANNDTNLQCCDLKKLASEYAEIIDSITNKLPKPPTSWVPPNAPAEESKPASKENVQRSFGGGASQSKLPDMDIKAMRFCPICLKNMSWMPPLATCPNCGVKPMPAANSDKASDVITADEILKEFTAKNTGQSVAERLQEEDKRDCRCTCKFGKVCVHCRIRKICEESLNPPESMTSSCPKVDKTSSSPKVKKTSSDDFCVVDTSSNDCRPYLARVFSELRDLYDIHEQKKKSSELATKCDMPPQKRKTKGDDTDSTKSGNIEGDGHGNNGGGNGRGSRGGNGGANGGRNGRGSRGGNGGGNGGSSGGSNGSLEKKPTTSKYHKNCVDKSKKGVPRRNGWLWQKSEEARKRGWRPGDILKPTKNIMRFFLEGSSTDNSAAVSKELDKAALEAEEEKPLLNICQKNNEIFITVRPARDPGNCCRSDAKPIIFKIVKSSVAKHLSDMKKLLKSKGFPKCKCHKPIFLCTCRTSTEKRELCEELGNECAKRRLPNLIDKMVLTDTSDNEMEYDFDIGPSIGMANPKPKPKKKLIDRPTQYVADDLQLDPIYPVILSPEYRTYDCATQSRYTGQAWGEPGDAIYGEDYFDKVQAAPRPNKSSQKNKQEY